MAPTLNEDMRALNSFAESRKLYNSYFTSHTCITTSFMPQQWRSWTKRIQLYLFHFLIPTLSTNTANPLLVAELSKSERKSNCGLPSFFPSMSSFLAFCRWVANAGKDMDKKWGAGVLWSLVLFRDPLPFCIQSTWFQQKAWCLITAVFPLPQSQTYNQLALSLTELQDSSVPTQHNRAARKGGCALCSSSLLTLPCSIDFAYKTLVHRQTKNFKVMTIDS